MSNHLNLFFLLFLFLLLILCGPTNGRFITLRQSSYDVVSDGGVHQVHASPYPALNGLSAADSCCDQTYGFLPCTTSVLGNLFLILVYGYFMFVAATYMSDGSELLLEILGPGIVGGLLLPILGAAPDSIIILGTFHYSNFCFFFFLFFFFFFFFDMFFCLFCCLESSFYPNEEGRT
jgi:hypothetical protein